MAWLHWSLLPGNRAKADAVLAADLDRRRREAEQRIKDRERAERSGELDAIRERCGTLKGFIREAWHVIEPAKPLIWGWALDAMVDHLKAVSDGDVRDLLMNVPPGFMKSQMTCVYWPGFEWGVLARPAERYLEASHEKGLAERNVSWLKDLVASDWYQDLWPAVSIIGQGAGDEFHLTATGWAQATAAASLTGHRGTRLIFDDPHNIEGGDFPVIRKKTVRRFRETGPTRLNDPEKDATIVIMQRVHEEDVSGVILAEKMGFTHLEIPMEFEPDRKCYSYDRHGAKIYEDPRTYDGEPAFPERFTPEANARAKTKMTAYAWSGQMQQRPVPRDGGLFKRSWFEVVDALPMGGQSARAWDLAGSKKKAEAGHDPDWTVGLKGFRVPDGDFYVTDMVRLRDTPGKVAATLKNTASQDGHGTRISLAQDPGQAGKFQIDFYISMLAGYTVESDTISGDKQLRAGPAATQAEFGKIKILRAAWNADFFEEVCNFPGAKHDDIVDALADLIRVLSSMTVYDLSNVG